jgi:hypothetical protein
MKHLKTLTAIYILLTTVCACFLPGHGLAQTVKPGKGYDLIMLGDNLSKITQTMGEPTAITDVKQEKKNYQDGGYDPKSELPFFLKFDQVYDYWGEAKDNPVFKIYFREEKVVYIIISSYVCTEEVSTSTSTPQAVRLLDPAGVLDAAYGKPDVQRTNGNEIQDWYYLSRGLGAAVEDSRVVVFELFPVLNEKQIKSFAKRCNK